MSKSQNAKKNAKKEPKKTMQEKKNAKTPKAAHAMASAEFLYITSELNGNPRNPKNLQQ